MLCKVWPHSQQKAYSRLLMSRGATRSCQSKQVQLQGVAADMAQPDACTCDACSPSVKMPGANSEHRHPCFAPSAVPR